jgi:hypothetical protein
MITVVLDIADNGIVKVLEDDNINGAGETFISKKIYTFNDDPSFKNRVQFLHDLCLDINLELGNDLDEKKLKFIVGHGPKFKKEMTITQLKAQIGACESLLVKYKKELSIKEDEIKS